MSKLQAGLPYTLLVADPVADGRYYAQYDGTLHMVRYIGRDGYFDSYPFHAFQWITGPRAGVTDKSYSVLFWKKPTRAQKRIIWNELTGYEQEKLTAGGYPGLRASDFHAPEAPSIRASTVQDCADRSGPYVNPID